MNYWLSVVGTHGCERERQKYEKTFKKINRDFINNNHNGSNSIYYHH